MTQKTTSERLGESMDRARRHWRVRRTAETAAGLRALSHPFSIAISREAGASGSVIARMLGEKLDWPVYDRELLQKIADEMGLRTELVESVDEKRGSWLRECLESFSAARPFSENAYVSHLIESLLSLATHGQCVVVGRGAPQILPPESTLRVRLVAPRRDRIAVIRKKLSLPLEEAERWVDQTDRDRSQFVRDHFLKDPANPTLYDLVLNTSSFTLEECTDLILDALRRLQARKPAER